MLYETTEDLTPLQQWLSLEKRCEATRFWMDSMNHIDNRLCQIKVKALQALLELHFKQHILKEHAIS